MNKNKQSGFAHIAILLLAVVVVAVGGAGYYVMSKQKDKSSGTATSQTSVVADKAVADACNKQLNDKDFCKFASNWKGLDNYKAVLTSTGKDGNTTMTMESENSEKSRTTISSGGTEVSAYVVIGKSMYTKDITDNTWTKFTDDTPTTKSSTNVKEDIKIDDFNTTNTNKTQYKKIGSEKCGNLTCLKYQIIDPADTANEQFITFDTKVYLMRSYSSKNADGTATMTFTYDNVKISEPSPIKTASTSSADAAAAQKQLEEAMKAIAQPTEEQSN